MKTRFRIELHRGEWIVADNKTGTSVSYENYEDAKKGFLGANALATEEVQFFNPKEKFVEEEADEYRETQNDIWAMEQSASNHPFADY